MSDIKYTVMTLLYSVRLRKSFGSKSSPLFYHLTLIFFFQWTNAIFWSYIYYILSCLYLQLLKGHYASMPDTKDPSAMEEPYPPFPKIKRLHILHYFCCTLFLSNHVSFEIDSFPVLLIICFFD